MKRVLTVSAAMVTLVGLSTPAVPAAPETETVLTAAAGNDVEYEPFTSFLPTDGGGGGSGPPEFPAGSTVIGSACDDCVIAVSLPFPVTFYGETYTSANVSSNGNVQFATNSPSAAAECLPNAAFGPTIFVFQRDTRTNNLNDPGDGIRTATTGDVGSRRFVIEWRVYYFGSLDQAHYVLWFDESGGFSFGYSSATDKGAGAVVGVQASATGPFTQYSCQQILDPIQSRQIDYVATLPLTVTRTGSGKGTVTSAPFGITCGATCTDRFSSAQQVSLTADPASSSTFTGWSGDCSGTATCIVDMDVARAVTAAFKLKPKRCAGYDDDPRKHIVGTSRADTLTGTTSAEIICGLGAKDTIRAGGGGDLVLGGGGNDTLIGGAGKDAILGGAGSDTMYGSDGDDSLTGSHGSADAADGGAGRDRCRAEFKRKCEY